MANLKKDFFWNTAGSLSNTATTFFIVIFITRSMGLEISGIYTYSLSLVGIWTMIAAFGGALYQLTDSSNEFSGQSYLFSKILTSGLALILGSIHICILSPSPFRIIVALILLSQACLGVVEQGLLAVLQSREHLYLAGQIIAARSGLTVLGFFFSIYFLDNFFVALLFGPLIVFSFVVFLEYPTAQKLEHFQIFGVNYRLEFGIAYQSLRKSFLNFLSTLLVPVSAFLPRFFIEQYHENFQGIFGIIFLPYTIIALIGLYIYAPAIVPLTNNYRDGNYVQLSKNFLKIIAVVFSIGGVLAPFVYLFGVPLFELLYNVDIAAHIFDLLLVVLLGVFQIAFQVVSLFFQITRRLSIYLLLNLFQVILLFILCFLMIPSFGITGAVSSMTVSSGCTFLLSFLIYGIALKKMRKELEI